MKNRETSKVPLEEPAGSSMPDEQTLLSLRESEAKYSLLMELNYDGIVIVQKGVIRESNYCLAKMCGYSLEEIFDARVAGFFRCDDVAALESICEDSLKDPYTVESLQATLVCKNGYQLRVEITAAPCTFRQQPANILIIRDISQRPDVGAHLKEHRQLDSIAAISGGIAHD